MYIAAARKQRSGIPSLAALFPADLFLLGDEKGDGPCGKCSSASGLSVLTFGDLVAWGCFQTTCMASDDGCDGGRGSWNTCEVEQGVELLESNVETQGPNTSQFPVDGRLRGMTLKRSLIVSLLRLGTATRMSWAVPGKREAGIATCKNSEGGISAWSYQLQT